MSSEADNTVWSPNDGKRQLLTVYGLYLAAAVVLTWPVAWGIGRDLPGGGPGDPQVYVWNIWWLKHALFRLHENPLWCSQIAWPLGCSLVFHTHTFLYGAVAIALSVLGINVAASVMLLFLNSFALTGLGTYLWCREFRAGRRGAFVGGFVVAFSIYRFGRGLCHYNLLATEFLPFFWLFLKRSYETGRLRSFLCAAVFSLLSFWQDIQIFLLAVLFGFFYLACAVISNPQGVLRRSVWQGAAAATVVFLLGSLPYWMSALPLFAEGEFVVRDGAPTIAADILSFFVPWPYHWLVGRWTKYVYARFPSPAVETAYVGYVAILLAVVGLWKSRGQGRRIWWLAIAGLVFLVLSFGENVRLGGRTTFRWFGDTYTVMLPGELFNYIPGLRQFRVFSRFIFLAVFALAVPVAMGADWLEQRIAAKAPEPANSAPRARRWLAPILLILISVEVAPLPYLTHSHILPKYAPFSLLDIIRNDPETTMVFTVPPTICQSQEQYFQIFHEKPIFGGNVSRRPDYLWRRYYGMPAVGHMFWERESELDEQESEKVLTAEFVDRFIEMHNVKYLLLAPAPKYSIVRRLIESRFPTKRQWHEEHFILYELERPPADRPLNIDLGQLYATLYLGRGFWPPSDLGCWAVQREAELKLPIHGEVWRAIAIEMTPFAYSGSETQTAELFLNDRLLGKVSLKPHLAFYQFAIPREALDGRPCSTLRFRFRYCIAPIEVTQWKDRRTLAAAIRQLHVLYEPREDLPLVGQAAQNR